MIPLMAIKNHYKYIAERYEHFTAAIFRILIVVVYLVSVGCITHNLSTATIILGEDIKSEQNAKNIHGIYPAPPHQNSYFIGVECIGYLYLLQSVCVFTLIQSIPRKRSSRLSKCIQSRLNELLRFHITQK